MMAWLDLFGTEAVDHDADRMSHADGVGDLDLAAIGETGGHDVLGHVTSGVGSRTIDLRRVLAREGAAAVPAETAVGVDDDLAPGQPGVAHGPADDELAGRVDVELGLLELRIVQTLGQHRPDDVVDQVGPHERVDVDAVLVLGGDDHRRDELRLAVYRT